MQVCHRIVAAPVFGKEDRRHFHASLFRIEHQIQHLRRRPVDSGNLLSQAIVNRGYLTCRLINNFVTHVCNQSHKFQQLQEQIPRGQGTHMSAIDRAMIEEGGGEESCIRDIWGTGSNTLKRGLVQGWQCEARPPCAQGRGSSAGQTGTWVTIAAAAAVATIMRKRAAKRARKSRPTRTQQSPHSRTFRRQSREGSRPLQSGRRPWQQQE